MTRLFINNIITLDQVTSTNSYAYDLLRKGQLNEGDVIVAKYQNMGLGQSGKKWESQFNKNLLMSIILSPDLSIQRQFYLNMCICLALYDFLEKYINQGLSIKWPNDIFVLDHKISGILIKNILKQNMIKDSIVGIGINVNQKTFNNYLPPAISMKHLTKINFNIDELVNGLLLCIQKRYYQLKLGSSLSLKKEYMSRLYRFQDFSAFKVRNKEIIGKIIGIDDLGQLLIKINNKVESFRTQEISFLF